ncbi:hypothetical protein NPIL_459071 [Nephila pilipes]|uniref:Uncharacterized protein n=1 Tax=Nephila pilipes TaxID=299642 RepID=A0A8X6M9S7_NEPPI|nr:hypothetical protein NPIL_459071 [Nephila pilipes]
MDTGQLTQKDPSAKCARISLLQKQLECQEIRQIYLKSLINIEEREVQHAVTPQWKTLDAERKQLEKEMKLAAGELTLLFPCPVQNCLLSVSHNINKLKKRVAETIISPPNLIITEKIAEKPKNKNTQSESQNQKKRTKFSKDANLVSFKIPTKNSFSALDDVRDIDRQTSSRFGNPAKKLSEFSPMAEKSIKVLLLLLQVLFLA